MKSQLFSGAAAVVIATASPTFVAAQVTAGTASGAENGVAAEGDIIVTAQRRSERQQDVPISISAFTGTQLATQGITSNADLTQITPGLNMTQFNSNVQPFIRGIGSSGTNLGETGSVATYIDGVYIPIQLHALFDLANIESIEVLKGPQGTLFGRNTAGGAINITTKAPQFRTQGRVEARYGNLDYRAIRGYVTGPLSDKVAASVTGSFNQRDGYFRDLFRGGRRTGDSKKLTLRGGLLFEPSDLLSIRLSADYTYDNDNSGILIRPLNGYLGRTPTSLYPLRPYDYVGNVEPIEISRQSGVSAHVDYDLGTVKLVSISAYRRYKTHVVLESDASPLAIVGVDNTEGGHVFSQELQLLSNGNGPLSWIIGAYYGDQLSEYDPLLSLQGAVTNRIDVDLKNIVYAGYVDGTYTLGNFEFTGGIRYSSERKQYDGSLNGAQLVNNVGKTWKSVTPRAVLSYHPNRSLLAYASYSAGFKSGAFAVSSFSRTPLSPEKIDAFELGLKFSPSRAVTLNTAVFLYNAKNLQVQFQNPTTGLQSLVNAAKSRSKGGEVELVLRPIEGLSIRTTGAYLDSEYRDFPAAQIFVPFPAAAPPALPDSLGNQPVSRNVAGNTIQRSPKWTGNISLSYDIPAGDGKVVPSANLFASSSYFWDIGNRLKQSAYTLINAEIAWHLPGDHMVFGAWAKNIGDKRIFRTLIPNRQTDRALYSEPRTYGVKLSYQL